MLQAHGTHLCQAATLPGSMLLNSDSGIFWQKRFSSGLREAVPRVRYQSSSAEVSPCKGRSASPFDTLAQFHIEELREMTKVLLQSVKNVMQLMPSGSHGVNRSPAWLPVASGWFLFCCCFISWGGREVTEDLT